MSELSTRPRDITIAGRIVPADELISILREHLHLAESLQLTLISLDPSLGAIFLAKVMKRESFADIPDLVAWVRKALA